MQIEDQNKILHSPFDYETHSKTFIQYCETVIYPDGLIEYSIPSHQEKIIDIYSKKHGISVDGVRSLFWNDYAWMDKILDDIGVVLVWYDYLEYRKSLTEEQEKAINKLIEYGCIDKDIERIKLWV